MMQIEFGMAKKYVDDLSDNIKRGIRAKLEKGWLPLFLPWLSQWAQGKDDRERPERFSIIRMAWDLLFQDIRPIRLWGFWIINSDFGQGKAEKKEASAELKRYLQYFR